MQRWCVLIVVVTCVASLAGAVRVRSVWEGVYTPDQAKRGESVYGANCAKCHGPSLAGSELAPNLAGESFLKFWYGKTVADLFRIGQRTMPKDAPNSLPDEQYADVLAFILHVNRFPAGTSDLPRTVDSLLDIVIDRRP